MELRRHSKADIMTYSGQKEIEYNGCLEYNIHQSDGRKWLHMSKPAERKAIPTYEASPEPVATQK
uniref:Uncharacterized protein n=1 Tax=Moniliophthora roreri TaxID=221103 RepID=A0A0W0GBN8_MONRR